jgi:hypothetical protein
MATNAYFYNMTSHKMNLTVGSDDQVEIDALGSAPYTPNNTSYPRTDLPEAPSGEFGGQNPVSYHLVGSDIRPAFEINVDTEKYSSEDTDILIFCFLESVVGMAANDSKPYLNDAQGNLNIPDEAHKL